MLSSNHKESNNLISYKYIHGFMDSRHHYSMEFHQKNYLNYKNGVHIVQKTL